MLEPSFTDPAQFLADSDPRKVGRVARRLFLGIASAWKLSDSEPWQLLGMKDEQTYQSWVQTEEALSSTILERISLLTGIQQALLALVPADHAGAWVRQDNPAFHGQQVIQVMISEGTSGMVRVRRYLEAQLHS